MMSMEGKQEAGDGLAGMSKTQLYDIMSQMKTLIEQNKQQARQILIQNPALTRALFQAQIMLGMVQPPQGLPKTQSSLDQQPNVEPAPAAQKQRRTEQPSQTMPIAPPSQAIYSQSQPVPSHSLPPRDHFGPLSTPVSLSQPSQVPNMTQLPQHVAASQPTQSQQPLHSINNQYMPLQPPLQTSIPPQPRVPVPNFPQQGHSQMGQNMGYQRPSGPQMHPPQAMFHSGTNPTAGLGPPFQQGQLPRPNQPLPPSQYQGGSPHLGMEFSQSRPPSSFAGQAGPSNQPPRPPPLTNELEKALLQQVMSLTPEQINMLPIEQRNQILQLQQMLRQ